MPASFDEVLTLLDLEVLDPGLYRGSQPTSSVLPRVFGGQVAAQSVMAAQMSVPEDRLIHSLHTYFLRGGDPSIPIIYEVENVRDGGTFSTRRVSARQHGKNIFYMTASFQQHEEGRDHQDVMPDVPAPEDTTRLVDVIAKLRPGVFTESWKKEWSSFDLRFVGDNRSPDDTTRKTLAAVQRMWFRADGTLPDSQILHNAAFTYISDFSLLAVSLLPHHTFIGAPDVMAASLDHVIWFHRPIQADEWLLYDQTSPSASGGRGLSTARVFNQAGQLVATVAQEGMIRVVNNDRPSDRTLA